MPIRCLSDKGELKSYEISLEGWADLKSTYRDLNLRTPCCGLPAIPKTSSLGTRFFAHKQRDECTSGPESKEHILVKTIIAKTASDAGWEVTTEFPGQTPDGKKWLADVYATRGSIKVAFEVQLSGQTSEETYARHEIYKQSGIRTLWLFHQLKFPTNKDLPSFRLMLNKHDEFVVFVNTQTNIVSQSALNTLYSDHKGFCTPLPLANFIKAALNKHLYWGLPPNFREPVLAFTYDIVTCSNCRAEYSQLTKISEVVGGYNVNRKRDFIVCQTVFKIPADRYPAIKIILDDVQILRQLAKPVIDKCCNHPNTYMRCNIDRQTVIVSPEESPDVWAKFIDYFLPQWNMQ